MKRSILAKTVLATILLIHPTIKNCYAQHQDLKSFHSSVVRILDGPFYNAQQADLKYILALDTERLLVPFLREAGIPTTAAPYGNWENTGLDGHIGGHYLSALALMYASTGNEELQKRLDFMIGRLAECQQRNGNGYVGGIPGGNHMWKEIAEGKIKAQNFSLNDKWVPLYNIHKLYAGLRDAYIIAGNQKARDVLIKLSDWFVSVTSSLSDDQLQQMLQSEHGGMNEVFADVSDITGEKKYLDLAQKLSHNKILIPLKEKRDELTGLHANTQIPKVIGFKRIASLSNDTTWSNAAKFFWNTVVDHRSVSIGGNSVREHFHPIDDFSSMIESNQGPETCNSYNMLRLTKLLFLTDPDGKYMDYYERTLYNHILSSQHPDGGFVYFTPMRPRHYRVYSEVDQSFWCCVGSGLENHGKYNELIYAHNGTDIYVNLFIASTLNWKEKGVTIQQSTDFPYKETSTLKVLVSQPSQFKIYVRQPGWIQGGKLSLKLNGKAITAKFEGPYWAIDHKWKNGDVISVSLPMSLRTEHLPDGSPWASFFYGPIVLATVTDTADLSGLRADDSRMGHVANGKFYPIDEAPVIIKTSENFLQHIKRVKSSPLAFSISQSISSEKDKQLTLIPFYELHDARYMIYWQVATPENFEILKQTLIEKEEKLLKLNELTVDWVSAGEQQPETEHSFAGEDTESGSTEGRAWRMARGWFSYDFADKNKGAKVLRLACASKGPNRKFDIMLNGKLFKTVELTSIEGKDVIEIEYEVPANLNDGRNGEMNIKFVAHNGSNTGRIYEVRLLKSSAD